MAKRTTFGGIVINDFGYVGNKIFITWGDHDLTDNILHFVLARTPESPPGIKGISLFLVPKRILAEDSKTMVSNDITTVSIERKLGLHGSPTCVLSYGDSCGSVAYLVGEESQGLVCMFTMMNKSRISVGVDGIALSERAYQKALGYARERVQGNPPGYTEPGPILHHPDVRRMLMTQKALVEGSRALTYMAAKLVDTSNFGPPDERDRAGQLLDFLTPIVKGFITEVGFEAVNHAVQIFGGHGYIRESGIEQLVRDARITMIYEGTTQIQALDLLGRKVLMNQGVALMDFLELVNDEAAASDYPELGEIATRWAEVSSELGRLAVVDANEVGAASFDYLMFSGYATLAYLWSKMARAAGTDDFGKGKRAAADFFFSRLLPRAESHRLALLAGADSLMKIEAGHFSHH